MSKFTVGQQVYFIESNRTIIPAVIKNIQNEFCLLKLINTSGGLRLRQSRLFASQEEAEQSLSSSSSSSHNTSDGLFESTPSSPKRKGYLPYDVWA